MMELALPGDITYKQAEEIVKVTKYKMDSQFIWETLDAAIAEAEVLFQSGDRLAVHGGYLLAFDLLDFVWPGLSGSKTREVWQAQCNIFTKLSLIDLRLGTHDQCPWRQARTTFNNFEKYCLRENHPVSENDSAEMKVCSGYMLAGHGQYEQAIREFERACTLLPLDETIKKRLEDLKARGQEPQRMLEHYIRESDRSRQTFSAAFRNSRADSRNLLTTEL